MWKALDITGTVRTTIHGHTLEVHGQCEELIIDLPDRVTGKALARQLPGKSVMKKWITTIHEALCQSDLRMQIRFNQKPLLMLGARTQPGFFSRLLGFGPAEVRTFSVLRFLFF